MSVFWCYTLGLYFLLQNLVKVSRFGSKDSDISRRVRKLSESPMPRDHPVHSLCLIRHPPGPTMFPLSSWLPGSWVTPTPTHGLAYLPCWASMRSCVLWKGLSVWTRISHKPLSLKTAYKHLQCVSTPAHMSCRQSSHFSVATEHCHLSMRSSKSMFVARTISCSFEWKHSSRGTLLLSLQFHESVASSFIQASDFIHSPAHSFTHTHLVTAVWQVLFQECSCLSPCISCVESMSPPPPPPY